MCSYLEPGFGRGPDSALRTFNATRMDLGRSQLFPRLVILGGVFISAIVAYLVGRPLRASDHAFRKLLLLSPTVYAFLRSAVRGHSVLPHAVVAKSQEGLKTQRGQIRVL